MSLEIEQEHYDYLFEKYEKLIINIAYHITGDNALHSSIEDNKQELLIKMVEAVHGFQRQTGLSPEEFVYTKGFDRYIKTCMWNLKNNIGNKIVKKAPILRTVSVMGPDPEKSLDIEDRNFSLEFPVFTNQSKVKLSNRASQALDIVVNDPSVLKENGRLNVSRLASSLGETWYETNKVVQELASFLEGELIE